MTVLARRPNDLFRERFQFDYNHAQLTADETVKLIDATRAGRITRAYYVNPTGLAEDATNFFAVQLLKGATVVASYSTDSAGAGTNSIAADTFTELTLSATDADRVFAAGDDLSFKADEGGTATLPPGRLIVEGYYL